MILYTGFYHNDKLYTFELDSEKADRDYDDEPYKAYFRSTGLGQEYFEFDIYDNDEVIVEVYPNDDASDYSKRFTASLFTAEQWRRLKAYANNYAVPMGLGIIASRESMRGCYDIIADEKHKTLICEYAESEDEIAKAILDAWRFLDEQWKQKASEKESVSFRKIPGWTHGDPALIQSLTNVALYFRDTNADTIEFVPDSVDFYEDRVGYFCVNSADYDRAYDQVYEHDELGIER